MRVSENLKRSTKKKITILIADDHPVYRTAVRKILEDQDDFVVVAEANNGVEAVNLVSKFVPNVVIMDISMPELNGLDATRQIKEKYPQIAVLVLTVHDDAEHILGILKAGAAGYLTKSAIDEEIITAIRSVVTGEAVMATHVFQQVLQYAEKYLMKPLAMEYQERLTTRELEVLKLAAKGLSNKEISRELNLSISTIKAYMVEIFSKFDVSSRTEAVITGIRAGLINDSDIK